MAAEIARAAGAAAENPNASMRPRRMAAEISFVEELGANVELLQ